MNLDTVTGRYIRYIPTLRGARDLSDHEVQYDNHPRKTRPRPTARIKVPVHAQYLLSSKYEGTKNR